MRKLGTFVVVIGILAGSYYFTFGIPASLQTYLGIASTSSPDAGQGAGQADAPRGRSGGAGRDSATMVALSELKMEPYEDILRAVGSAVALRSTNAIAEVSGEVTATHLDANREVQAGDILVQLDARTETLNLEIAQAELEQAQDTVLRYERLGSSGNSTITDVALSEARVGQRLAEANVGLAQIALENRTIRAPIAGMLGLSEVEVGDFLSANAVIATIDDSRALLVEFELPERAIGMLATVDTISASTPTFRGRNFEGRIVAFDSRIDSVTRSVTVKAHLDNPDGILWPGMTFAVRLIHESAPIAVLPSTAVTWSRSGSSVWVDNEGTVEQVPVTILFRRDDQVWIDAPIEAGAMVVTEGAQKLRAGSRIRTAQAVKARRPASEVSK